MILRVRKDRTLCLALMEGLSPHRQDFPTSLQMHLFTTKYHIY